MATQPKSLDPAAAALSAIEAALNMTGQEETAPKAPKVEVSAPELRLPMDAPAIKPGPRLPEIADDELSKTRNEELQSAMTKGNGPNPNTSPNLPPNLNTSAANSQPAANDDRRSVGQILQTMQTQSNRTPVVIGTALAAFWLALWSIYGFSLWSTGEWAYVAQHTKALLIFAAFGPAALFIVFGALIRRTQEMRLTARLMTEVALRLAEPESLATESVVSLSQAIRREIASMGDGIERALARASELETIVRAEVSNLERAYSENERRIRTLLEGLSSEREAITTNAERVKQAISGAHENLSQELEVAGKSLADRVGDAGAHVTSTLGTKGEEITLALSRTGETLVEKIDSHGTQIVERMSTTGQDVSRKLTDASEIVATKLAQEIGTLDQKLKTTGESLVTELTLRGNEVSTRLDETGQHITSTITSGSEDLATRLQESSNFLGKTLATQTEALVDRLGTASVHLTETISSSGEELANRLQESSEFLDKTLTTHTDSLVDRLGVASVHLAETISTHNTSLTDTLLQVAEDLSTKLEEKTQTISQTLAHESEVLTSQLDERSNALLTHLSSQSSLLTDNLEQARTHLVEAISEQNAHLTDSLSITTEDLTRKLASQSETFTVTLTNTSDTLVETLTQKGEALTQRLDETAARLSSTIVEDGFGLAHKIDASAQQLHETIVVQGQKLQEELSTIGASSAEQLQLGADQARLLLDDHVQTIEARFAHSTSEAISALGTHGERINEAVATRLKTYDETIVAHGSQLTENIATHTSLFTNLVSERMASVEAAFTTHAASFTDRLSDRAREAAELIEAKANDFTHVAEFKTLEVASQFDTHISRFEETAQISAQALGNAIDGHINSFNESARSRLQEASNTMELVQNGLDARSSAMTESLVENALTIARVMNEGVEKISTAVDPVALETVLTQRIAELNSSLTNRTKQLQDTLLDQGGVLQTLLENKGPMLVERLTARGHEIAQEVASVAELVTDAISEKTSSIINRLGETSIEITRSFDQSTNDLQKLFEKGTGTSVHALLTTNEKLKEDLSDVLQRLAETSIALNGVVNEAGNSLEAIEGTLTNRVRDFQGSVTAISNQINNLNTASLTTLSQTDALVERLHQEHDNLATSANAFAQSQREIDRLLLQRNQSLESLLANVHSKTDEMESVLDSFTSIFEEAVRKADTRAREIGAYLSDATQGLTSQIGLQFEDIRNSGTKERERTATALRTLYDQANSEMAQMFEQSLSRFQSSAAELRGIAAQVQQDIDAARQEVRRGANELPRETAEQAAALRRVVGDQISALKQLTDIVNKSGQPLDIGMPVSGMPVSPLGLQQPLNLQPLAPAAPYRAPEPLRASEPFRAPEPLRAPPIMSGPMIDPVPPLPREDYSGRMQRATPTAPRPSVPDRGQAGQGWISDLLARASREEQRLPSAAPMTAPQMSGDPLQGISLDIASMVDHLAVSDVWDRYNRGERNIFSRRLYTAQGQQTFDEIRRRYRAEPEFRETVNRYNREFERLLNEINRDDRDGGMVRSYLISDTGKVYTMLAHAAGRLE